MNESLVRMPPEEATEWLNQWERGPEETEEPFPKWSPQIVADRPEDKALLEKSVLIAWEAIKKVRPPCFEHRLPSVPFTSKPVVVHNGQFYQVTEIDRAAEQKFFLHVHTELPDVIRAEDLDIASAIAKSDPENRIASQILEPILCPPDLDGASLCGVWTSEVKKGETRKRCPKCGGFGSGEGKVGNARRFFHERHRSCYLGMANPKPKRPLTTCPRCRQPGRESLGKDGYMRIRHKDKVCYIG